MPVKPQLRSPERRSGTFHFPAQFSSRLRARSHFVLGLLCPIPRIQCFPWLTQIRVHWCPFVVRSHSLGLRASGVPLPQPSTNSTLNRRGVHPMPRSLLSSAGAAPLPLSASSALQSRHPALFPAALLPPVANPARSAAHSR